VALLSEVDSACWAGGTPPLWNFSSMGGTIMRSFLKSSLLAGDMVG